MSEATITRGPATIVGLGSVYSAAVAYVTLLVAARALSHADNATFLVFWALLYGSYGVVTGVSPEAARASYQHHGDHGTGSILGIALGFGALIGAVIALSAPLWADHILTGHVGLALVAALGCLAYTGHLAVWGVLTGQRNWSAVAGLTFAEATVRLGLVFLAYALFDTMTALAVAATLSATTWIVGLLLPTLRRAARGRSDVLPKSLLANYAFASIASAASASMMVGFPVLISATSTTEELAGAAALILGISLTRAPLMVPLTALQGVALTHFMRTRDRGLRALWGVSWPVLAVTAIGAVLAGLIGSWLFRLLLGASYFISGSTLAILTTSAGLLAILTLTGMFALALHRHALFAVGWVSATVLAVAMLLLGLPLTERVLLGLVAGPLLGIVIHVVGLVRLTPRRPAIAEPNASDDVERH